MSDYDLFISYSHEDRDWVKQKLLPRLEGAGLKVAIDYRDFALGVPSIVNMGNFVERSRHILLVLTPRWVSSQWTGFEGVLAGTADPIGKQQKLIPLMLEDCDPPSWIKSLSFADFRSQQDLDSRFAQLVNALAHTNGTSSNGASVPQPVAGQPIAAGVTALQSLTVDSAQIREAAATFRAVFQSACEQIKNVAEYKNLHDQLHELQIKCYDIMAPNAARFPADEDAKTDFEECRLTFETVVEQLRLIAGRFTRTDTNWIQQLDAALLDLRNALAKDDPVLLQQALRKMERELSLRPPQINVRLNESARTLNLGELVEVLGKVQDYAARQNSDSATMREFKAGVASLAKMDASLSSLIFLHDKWQEVDTELRAMEKDLRNLEELGYWWPDFKPKALEISKIVSGDWATSFQDYGAKLELALSSSDTAKAKRVFRLIRHSVTIRFYQTDADLKSQCDELRKVGEPLTTVLRVI